MNIKLFKAKFHRWIFRSERESRKAKECNKCCITCKRYFECVNERPWWEEALSNAIGGSWIIAIDTASEAFRNFGTAIQNFNTAFDTAVSKVVEELNESNKE